MNKSLRIKNIKDIWVKVIDLTEHLRKKYKDNLDGLGLWNNLKKNLVDIQKDDLINWNSNHERIIYSLSEMKNSLKEYDDKKQLIEKNHFLLQLFNIPKKDVTAPFTRLIQLAFNIGQLKPLLNDKSFGFNVKQIFADNKLDQIETYMDDDNLAKYKIFQNDIDDILTSIENLKNNPNLKSQTGSGRYLIEYIN